MFVSFVPDALGRAWVAAGVTDLELLAAEPVAPSQRSTACLWVGLVRGRGELAKVWRLLKHYRCAVCLHVGGDTAAEYWRFDICNGRLFYASRETVLRSIQGAR
jgi:hypothetical protein